MRLNTKKSMLLARRVKGRYGTWQAVRDASQVRDGVFVVEGKRKQPEATKPADKPLAPA